MAKVSELLVNIQVKSSQAVKQVGNVLNAVGGLSNAFGGLSNVVSTSQKVIDRFGCSTAEAGKKGSKASGIMAGLKGKMGALKVATVGAKGSMVAFGAIVAGVVVSVLALVAGIVLLVKGTINFIKYMAKGAGDFDAMSKSIVKLTGATGDRMRQLEEVARRVSMTVPNSLEEVGVAVGDLNTRLGLTGESLISASKSMLDFSRVTGTSIEGATRNVTRLMLDWGVEVEDLTFLLDRLTVVSQKSGIGIEILSDTLTTYGVQMRTLGFDLTESLALMGKWEKEGVSVRKIMGGLSMALGTLAQDGWTDLQGGFEELTGRLRDAGLEGEALTAAIEVLGKRAGPDFALAVREGRFELNDWVDELENAHGMLKKTADESLTYKERFSMIGNTIRGHLEPLMRLVAQATAKVAEAIQNFLANYKGVIEKWVYRIGVVFMFLVQIIKTVLSWIARIPFVGKLLAGFKKGTEEVSNTGFGTKIKKETDKVEGGMRGAGKGADDLKKKLLGLAGFDEMNVLKTPDDSGSGDIGGAGGGGDMDLSGLDDLMNKEAEITNMVERIKEGVARLWADFKEKIQPFTDWVYKWIVTPILWVWNTWKKAVNWMIKKIKELAPGLEEFDLKLWLIVGVIGMLLAPFLLFVAGVVIGIAIVLIVIGLVILIVLALVLAVLWLAKQFEIALNWVAKKFDELKEWIKKKSEEWAKAIVGKVEEMRKKWSDFVQNALNYILNLRQGAVNRFNEIKDAIIGKIRDAMAYIQGRIEWVIGYFEYLKMQVKWKWEEIKYNIQTAINNARIYIHERLGMVLGYFYSLRDKVVGVFDGITGGISTAFSAVVGRLKHLINTFVIAPLNRARLVINKGLGVLGVEIKHIPELAKGGIISSPTTAIIGEAGKEAVLPLENNTGWMDDLAKKIGGGAGHLTVKIGDDTIYDKAIDYINDKSLRSGGPVLNL